MKQFPAPSLTKLHKQFISTSTQNYRQKGEASKQCWHGPYCSVRFFCSQFRWNIFESCSKFSLKQSFCTLRESSSAFHTWNRGISEVPIFKWRIFDDDVRGLAKRRNHWKGREHTTSAFELSLQKFHVQLFQFQSAVDLTVTAHEMLLLGTTPCTEHTFLFSRGVLQTYVRVWDLRSL